MRRSTIMSLLGVGLAGTVLGALIVGPVTAAGETPKAWGAGSEIEEGFLDAAPTTIIKRKIDAPGDGALMITGVASAEDLCESGGLGVMALYLVLDSTQVWVGNGHTVEPELCDAAPALAERQTMGEVVGEDTWPQDTTTVTAVVPVTAGDHTVKLQAQELGSGSWITERGLSIVFLPAGSGPLPWTPEEILKP